MKTLLLLFVAALSVQAGTVVCISAQTGNFSASSTWNRYDWTTGSTVSATPVACDVAIIGQYSGMAAPHVVTFDGASTTLGGLAQVAWSGCTPSNGATSYGNNAGVVHVTMPGGCAGVFSNGDSVLSWAVTGAGAAAINNRVFAVSNVSGAQFDLSGSTYTAAITGGVTERPAPLERLGHRGGDKYGQIIVPGTNLTVAGDVLDDYQSGTVPNRTGAWLLASESGSFNFNCAFPCSEHQASNNGANNSVIVTQSGSGTFTFNGGTSPGNHGSFKINCASYGCGSHDLTGVHFTKFGGNNSSDYALTWTGTGNGGGGDSSVAFSIQHRVTFDTDGGGAYMQYEDGATYADWDNVTIPQTQTDFALNTPIGPDRTTGVRNFNNVRLTGQVYMPSNSLVTNNLWDMSSGASYLASPQAGSGNNFFRVTANDVLNLSGLNLENLYLLWDDSTVVNPHAIALAPTGTNYHNNIAESTSAIANSVGIFSEGGSNINDSIFLPNAAGTASFFPCIQLNYVETCSGNTVAATNGFGAIAGVFCFPCSFIPEIVQNNLIWANVGAIDSPASCDTHSDNIADPILPDYNVKVNVTLTSGSCASLVGSAAGYIDHFVSITPGVHDLVLSGAPPLANIQNDHFALAMKALGKCNPSGPTDTAGCLTALKADLPGIMPQLMWRIRSYMAPTNPRIWIGAADGTTAGAVHPVKFPLPGLRRTVIH